MINTIHDKKVSKFLVLGGTGFIGTHLVKKILEMAAKITVVSLSGKKNKFDHQNVDFVKLDLNNYDEVSKFFIDRSFDYIINLSGYIDHSSFWDGGFSTIETHLFSQINLIKNIHHLKIKKYVQIGSSFEYGNSNKYHLENEITSPYSSYGFAKASLTNFIKMLHVSSGFPGVILRLFLVYGPNQKTNRFIPYVIDNCLRDKKIHTTHGQQYRDFCYIDDVVNGILSAAFEENATGEVFNISSGQAVQTQKIVDIIRENIGSGKFVVGNHERDEDTNFLCGNIDKAKRILKWKPKISLEEGLKKTILFYNSVVDNEK